jgi:hypothetical protein
VQDDSQWRIVHASPLPVAHIQIAQLRTSLHLAGNRILKVIVMTTEKIEPSCEQRVSDALDYLRSEARKEYSAQRIHNDGVDFATVLKEGFETAKSDTSVFKVLLSK